MDRGAWRASVHEVARVGHDLATIQEEEKEGSINWEVGIDVYALLVLRVLSRFCHV